MSSSGHKAFSPKCRAISSLHTLDVMQKLLDLFDSGTT